MQTIEVIPVQNDSNIKIPSNIPPINIGIVDVIIRMYMFCLVCRMYVFWVLDI